MKQPTTLPDGERLEPPRLWIEDVPELDEDYPALNDEDITELTDCGCGDPGDETRP